MKKLLAIIMILIMALSLLAACGARPNAQNTQSTAQNGDESSPAPAGNINIDEDDVADAVEDIVDDAIEHNAFSLAAAEAFWNAVAGVDVSDAAPDWDWVVNEERMSTYGDTVDSVYGHASISFEKTDGSEISEEEFRAWAEKLFNATAAASDDGHNIVGWEFVGEGEDALAEVSFEDAFSGGFMQGWGFVRDGRNLVVYLEEKYDSEKESQIGRLLYVYGAAADISYGMEASMDDLWAEIEGYEDEIEDALEDYFG